MLINTTEIQVYKCINDEKVVLCTIFFSFWSVYLLNEMLCCAAISNISPHIIHTGTTEKEIL